MRRQRSTTRRRYEVVDARCHFQYLPRLIIIGARGRPVKPGKVVNDTQTHSAESPAAPNDTDFSFGHSSYRTHIKASTSSRWQRLYFCPLPHWQGAFLRVFKAANCKISSRYYCNPLQPCEYSPQRSFLVASRPYLSVYDSRYKNGSTSWVMNCSILKLRDGA